MDCCQVLSLVLFHFSHNGLQRPAIVPCPSRVRSIIAFYMSRTNTNSPLPPPSYSEATTTDPLTTDGFVSPMTTTSSPVAFNVSVSPMAMTPITSPSTESFTLPPVTETDLDSRNHSTLEVAHSPRADSDCLPQAVMHDAPELALVEYAHNRDNLPMSITSQTNIEYASGLEVIPAPPRSNTVTPLHLLGDQPEAIDCPFCLRRSETIVKKKPSSTPLLWFAGGQRPKESLKVAKKHESASHGAPTSSKQHKAPANENGKPARPSAENGKAEKTKGWLF